ncbi:MAG: nickel-responsive transcriptional regulator NikR [Gemmatimonadetes bacterium]|nr:nickel-responsive transcriptional regulator NikR [Gemmatimonadota bacterium]
MSDLVRMSLSLDKPLFQRLERLVRRRGVRNRSEFLRDLIRRQLVEREWDADREVLGSVTLVYEHHRRKLAEKLTGLGHRHHGAVLVTTHVHLSEQLCAEVILIRGKARRIEKLADEMRQQKGVLHAELSMTTTGADLA